MGIYRPYFYIIEHVRTSTYYVGCQYKDGADPNELLVTYTTSSYAINHIIKAEGVSAFIIKKIKVFTSGDDAYGYETRFLKRLNCARHPRFYNRHNNNGGNRIHFTNSGYRWYTNGVDNSMFYPGTEPIGWVPGRTGTAAKNKLYYNNGDISRAFYPGTEPYGWVHGNLNVVGEKNGMYGKPSPTAGKFAYNNGETCIYLSEDDEVPDGWVRGATDDFKKKRSMSTTGENNPRYGSRNEKFYNDGKTTGLYVPGTEPDGWLPGMVKAGVSYYNNGFVSRKFVPGTEPDGWSRGKVREIK